MYLMFFFFFIFSSSYTVWCRGKYKVRVRALDVAARMSQFSSDVQMYFTSSAHCRLERPQGFFEFDLVLEALTGAESTGIRIRFSNHFTCSRRTFVITGSIFRRSLTISFRILSLLDTPVTKQASHFGGGDFYISRGQWDGIFDLNV